MEKKYFDIHVDVEGVGYSVFVEGDFTKKTAVEYAILENMFTEKGDEEYINNVTEITKEEYERATA